MAPPTRPVNPGPFYFAWVESTETTFGVEHLVEDELIFAARITHTENKIPSLEIDIQNPGSGLLNALRKRWAWFSWKDEADVVYPLFFGQVLGLPTDIFGEVVTIQLLAKPSNFGFKKRAAVESLRVPPYYDSIFIELIKQDDPDSVLNGYTRLWHVDRTTLDVTLSDEIFGEDGTEIFTEDDVSYTTVKMNLSKPQKAVRVEADVGWTQVYTGSLQFKPQNILTMTGGSFISSWPKPGTSVGDGWTVISSAITDGGVNDAQTTTFSFSFQNKRKTHMLGDTMSININWTKPDNVGATDRGYVISEFFQPGVLDPYTTDGAGNPKPTNIPTVYRYNSVYVFTSQFTGSTLAFRYDAKRERVEHLTFLLQADVQDIILSDSETDDSGDNIITLSGNNVDRPILNLSSWLSVQGQAVALDKFIFPSHPRFPGAKTIQICTTAGTAGTEEPDFSEIQGVTTVDGSVTWTSLGVTNITITDAAEWSALTEKAVGALLLPGNQFVISWAQLTQEGLSKSPRAGTNASEGQIISTTNGTFQQCTLDGVTGVSEPNFSSIWGTITNDGTVQWTSLGTRLPNGHTYYVCVDTGETGLVLPPFGEAINVGDTVTDGGVIWRCLAVGEIPIGGSVGMIPASVYWPTDRGIQSLEYCLCVASADLLRKSRVVGLDFEAEWERGINLSCRKNAILQDPRLPGGEVAGKIVQYTLNVDGDSGTQDCNLSLAGCIGKGLAIEETPGEPVYVDEDVIDPSIQVYEGELSLISVAENVGYAKPIGGQVDDGLVFPLTIDQAVLHEKVRGTLAQQQAAVGIGLAALKAAAPQEPPPDTEVSDGYIIKVSQTTSKARTSIDAELAKVPMTYELELAPIVNGPFEEWYSVETTKLVVPKHIDLEAGVEVS